MRESTPRLLSRMLGWQDGFMNRSPSFHVTFLVSMALAARVTAQEAADAPTEPALRVSTEAAFQGFTLLSPLNSKTIYLLDMLGETVHTWATECAPGGAIELLDNGHLLRCSRDEDNPRFHGGGICGHLEELDWDGKIVWHFDLATDTRTTHHDFAHLPNGNFILIAWEYRPRDDAIVAGRDPAQVGGEGMWPDMLLEIHPTRPAGGEIVWEWHAWDHLIQDFDAKLENHGDVARHPELIDLNFDHRDRAPLSDEERRKQAELDRQMRAVGYAGGSDPKDAAPATAGKELNPDWLHTNAIEYSPALDLILLSSPHMSEIWVLDHSTTTAQAASPSGGRYGKGGDLLYRFGNPRNYGGGGDADRRLFAQHDAQWLAGKRADEWRVLLFNNGQERPGGEHSSVDELVLPFAKSRGFARTAGGAFEPATQAWTYADPDNFSSGFISGAQRLPNGNTLICSGAQARVFEVTGDGRVVWDYRNPHGGEIPPSAKGGKAPPKALFRATRIAKDHPGLAGHKL